jgi:AbrB family looped-hinge helix DNA binding protein
VRITTKGQVTIPQAIREKLGILVDSNVILDVFEDDPAWFEWSASALERYGYSDTFY